MDAVVPREATLEPTSEVISILEEFLSKLEAGARLNPEDLTARCPALEEPLKACLASPEFLHGASFSLRDSAPPEPPSVTLSQTDFGRLGDFQLVREIGRGGMGVVYEAEQISLGRRVALKVLPFAAALDGRQLQRFKNEAQAAASLHHTNIVPVFGVGCERGVHYYAMQYIDEAIAACRRSIELKPDFADAHYILGNYLDDAGRPDEAEAAYRKAIALRPDHAESHRNLGMHSSNKGSSPRLSRAWSAATSWAHGAKTGPIRRPSGCKNAESSSSGTAGRDYALPRDTDLTRTPWLCPRNTTIVF
jgi:tetratricopeptide (TPR) repeat protein